MCHIARVSRSGYYKWLKRLNRREKDYDNYLLIKKIFEKGKKKLGWRMIQMRLRSDYGVVMNHKKIKRIKIKYNLMAKIRRRNPYKTIMKKTQEHRVFDNVLDRNFKQIIPGRVLCTDITYLYYGQGRKAYLQAIKDIATKEIISWQLSNNLTMPLVLKSVKKLENINYFTSQSLIHSDQGFHYTNPEYVQKIKELKLIQSMSGKGNCIDNSPMETFFGHLKDEVDHKTARTFKELYDMLNEYMNYYNNYRYQWGIKKMTPIQYRRYLLAQSV